MPLKQQTQLIADWQHLLTNSADLLPTLSRFITEHAAVLTQVFYQQMLTDEAARQFLSHDQVKSRLSASMEVWLRQLADGSDLAATLAQQVRIGEIHARVNVPVHVVLRGARCLKNHFAALALAKPELQACSRLFSQLVDMAMEVMSQAYAHSHDRSARNEEAYRLFSVSQNLAAERDRQKASLLDWENKLMFDCAVGIAAAQLPRLQSSEFGLWYRHKGAHAFQGTPESGLIIDTMQQIDEAILPLLSHNAELPEQHLQRLKELRELTKSLRYHLELLFEQNSSLEAGKDVMTRLLNRKFLPAVLSREVQYSRQNNSPFALLALDIDHFKRINDNYGHEAGDMVLQQLAVLMTNSCRGGDFLFRLGGEEFLLVLVDVEKAAALAVAEKLRKLVAAEAFLLPGGAQLQVTVSIGLALHNGHPDYQLTMRRADEALYQAKHQGRDQVVMAG
jgi:diguanylate cyclase